MRVVSWWSRFPVPTTCIIGRNQNVIGIRDRLDQRAATGTRVSTLTGPGGIGQTRLALAARRDLASLFQGRVAWVQLAAIRDDSLVTVAVADAIGSRPDSDADLIDTLETLLTDLPGLLILDSYERILGAPPRLATLLTRCEHVRVIATNRERLNPGGNRASNRTADRAGVVGHGQSGVNG